MGSRSKAANDAAGDDSAVAPENSVWRFHEVGALFRHFHADLKLDNVEPEAFSKASPEERLQIQEQMNSLLDRTRTRDEMFPDSRLTYSLGRMYFQVFGDETALMFPRADTDLRALYQRFAYLFRTSYLRKVIVKRLVIASSIVAYCLAILFCKWFCSVQYGQAYVIDTFAGIALVYFLSALPALILYVAASGIADQQFSNALQQSCTALSQNTLQRLVALKSCIDNIQIAIRDSYDLDEGKWMAQSDYLMALTIWLPLRVLHIERYLQMTMWRVHRQFVYIQYFALALQLALFLGLAGVVVVLGPAWFIGGALGMGLFLAAMAGFSVMSFVGKSTSVGFIRDNVPIDQWKTFGELRVDTVVSGVVGFLIKKFIMLRDVGRPNH